jgi:hypothetical protein
MFLVRKPSALNQARINHVPTRPLSNWMDISNVSIFLHDGQKVMMK